MLRNVNRLYLANVEQDSDIKDEIVQLVKFGLGGQLNDFRMYVSRLIRKYRVGDASFSKALESLLQSSDVPDMTPIRELGHASRRTGEAPILPVGQRSDVEKPFLPERIVKQVEGLLEERENASVLALNGLSPTSTAIFTGPPGVGKTMTARWIASQLGMPMYRLDLAETIGRHLGESGNNIKAAFSKVRVTPGILFLDEIDAIGQKRTGNAMGNSEREQTLNQLLTEMDGFNADDNVVILAATNRPESLDPALLRPGRFDRRVPVELPDLAGREAILKAHAKKVALGDDVDFHTIARMAAGASGAELANIVNEAALRAVRDHRDAVSQADLEESIEVVIAGYQKKNAILSDDEKKTVAYHEIGHALVAALQSHSAPVQKITIIPRTSGALGYTMQVDQQDKYILSREELENKIATLTGGRAAEEVVFNQVTTGASNDIEQATKLARAMITRYGMTDEFDMVAMETVTNKYLGGDTSLACAPETQKYIDAKVVSVVKEQHAKAKKILEDHRPALDALAKYLYEKETITGKEFMDILRAQTAGRD